MWTSVFISLEYIPICEIAKSHDNSLFKILRNCQPIFHSCCNSSHFHQQCIRVPNSPYPHQHPFFIYFFLSLPFWWVWSSSFIVGLIWTSLMVNGIGHLFVCLLSICTYSFEKHSFRSSAHFKLKCLFYYWIVTSFIYSRYKALIKYIICKNFPLSCRMSFHFLDSVPEMEKFTVIMSTLLLILLLLPLASNLRYHYPNSWSQRFTLIISFKNFTVWMVKFKSLS